VRRRRQAQHEHAKKNKEKNLKNSTPSTNLFGQLSLFFGIITLAKKQPDDDRKAEQLNHNMTGITLISLEQVLKPPMEGEHMLQANLGGKRKILQIVDKTRHRGKSKEKVKLNGKKKRRDESSR